MTQTTLDIIDDSGILTVVNTDKYATYVDEDWELDQLRKHIAHEMNQGNCICWNTGEPGSFKINIVPSKTREDYFRITSAKIVVSSEILYLVDYTDLTMAAQFKDEKLPSGHGVNYKFEVPNGEYMVHVCQYSDPKNYDIEVQEFDLVFESSNGNQHEVRDILWFE